jgi:hypothetical protein
LVFNRIKLVYAYITGPNRVHKGALMRKGNNERILAAFEKLVRGNRSGRGGSHGRGELLRRHSHDRVHLFGNHAMTHERRVYGFVLLKHVVVDAVGFIEQLRQVRDQTSGVLPAALLYRPKDDDNISNRLTSCSAICKPDLMNSTPNLAI